jgi:hypothetical protein
MQAIFKNSKFEKAVGREIEVISRCYYSEIRE